MCRHRVHRRKPTRAARLPVQHCGGRSRRVHLQAAVRGSSSSSSHHSAPGGASAGGQLPPARLGREGPPPPASNALSYPLLRLLSSPGTPHHTTGQRHPAVRRPVQPRVPPALPGAAARPGLGRGAARGRGLALSSLRPQGGRQPRAPRPRRALAASCPTLHITHAHTCTRTHSLLHPPPSPTPSSLDRYAGPDQRHTHAHTACCPLLAAATRLLPWPTCRSTCWT